MNHLPITRKNALEEGIRELKESGIEEAKVDAWLLLSDCLSIGRAEYYSHPDKELTRKEYEAFQGRVAKRKLRIPCQYVVGSQEFMGFSFQVNANVLIPRQDTEVLVEEALKVVEGRDVLDVCTGSGCIIISLAKLARLKRAVGTDVSEHALAIARRNGLALGVRVEWVQSDIWDKVTGSYDVIVSNPPYIASEEMKELSPEVKNYEPRLALDGGKDGLDFYRRLVGKAGARLNRNGTILLEVDCRKSKEVGSLLYESGFERIRIVKDLAGLDRVVTANWPGNEDS